MENIENLAHCLRPSGVKQLENVENVENLAPCLRPSGFKQLENVENIEKLCSLSEAIGC